MIDKLKAICTTYGLGNTGNEYKIITETFLYKFLNDKFFYELKKTVPAFKSKTTRELEKILVDMSDDERDSKMLYLSAHTAFLKPTQFISYLFNRHATKDFHKLFDDTLNDISDANKDIFSVKAGEGTSVKLFEPLSNYIVQPERRDDFCAAIITKLADVNFEELFSQKYDFFAEIFEYLIKDYNKDFGKYAEYYTPKAIARIIAKILVPKKVQNVRIYDPAAGSGTLILALAHEIDEDNRTLYTQDISQKSNEILRLNLILNNLIHSLPNVIQDDTLLNPRHLNLQQNNIATFDYVVSNPPFNMDFSETRDTLAGDNYRARFFAGVPNTPNKKKDGMAIYQLFLQHIIKSMNEQGKAAVVVPTGFLTASSGIALKIRQYIVNKKILRGVVSMPSNIFANTGTNVSVVFLDANSSDKALLVDASNLGTKQKVEGTKNQRTYLSDDEIERIINTFNGRQEVDDFSVLVSLNDIAQKNFSFSAGQYFKVKIDYVDLSHEEFQDKMRGFKSDLQKFFDEGHQLERNILNQLETLTYEEN
ncbi:MAG: SAM-dependent DNA methyltransferase [Selenomonadaceae bacterium]|nr:SAM-dependent DNA methyltransferase [Selenomonadaceae bacterium]